MKGIDSDTLAKIRSLRLRAQTVVQGLLPGLHRSRYLGHSLEFMEHRSYVPGDEIKLVDWKAYGKSDRLYVKQFEEEMNLHLKLLLDGSGSMAFKGRKSSWTKYEVASTLALCLSYIALKQKDSVGLSILESTQSKNIAPNSTLSHWSHIATTLENFEPNGETVLTQSLQRIAVSLKKRNLIILISDLLEESDPILNALKQCRFLKQEIRVLHLLDPDEIEFPYRGWIQFESLENREKLRIHSDSIRPDYVKQCNRWFHEIREPLLDMGISYHFHLTNESPEKILKSILET